jgi:NhaP-type Na+/H+ or K+/H+ antiporter
VGGLSRGLNGHPTISGIGDGPKWPFIDFQALISEHIEPAEMRDSQLVASASSAAVHTPASASSAAANAHDHHGKGKHPKPNGFVHLGKSKGVLDKERDLLKDHNGATPIHHVPEEGGKHHESTTHHGDEHHHVHEFMALLFLFVALILGAATLHLLTLYAPSVPYTAVLLIEGILLGMCHEFSDHNLGKLSVSINMWINIHPHLLLFSFLPALLFGDCMGTNWHTFKRCLPQILILAGPGVLMGSVATGWFAHTFLPYGFSWNVSLAFGAILAATDPVAVVALLNSVGASKKLTMVIAGESLFNDGTAIVVFTLFFNMAQGTVYGFGDICLFVLRMAFLAPIIGIAFGLGLVYWNQKAGNGADHNYPMIQVSISICVAYLCFYTAEDIIHSSGVLAVVSCGITFAAMAWPSVVSAESMGHVWHTIEHVGNTLLFVLTGVLMSHIMFGPLHREHLGFSDFMWLGILYLVVVALRFTMIGILYPAIANIGYKLDWRDCVVMSWGGLRGAVGLAMAVSMDASTSIDPVQGSKVLFMVGGVAVLTLLVNGMTSAFVLQSLGMTKTPETKKLIAAGMQQKIQEKALQTLRERRAEFAQASEETVKRLLHVLNDHHSQQLHESKAKLRERSQEEKLQYMRETYYNTLRATYWELVAKGVLTKHNGMTNMLLASIDVAQDNVNAPLHDWEHVEQSINKMLAGSSKFKGMMESLDKILPDSIDIDNKLASAGIMKDQQHMYMFLTCFEQAHLITQSKVRAVLGDNMPAEAALVKQLIGESNKELETARLKEEYAGSNSKVKQSVQTIQLANLVIEEVRAYVEKSVEEGVIDSKEAHDVMHHLEHDQRHLWKSASPQ